MVMRLLWKAVEAPPRNWRSISKALVLADHLLKHGAERVLGDVLQHVHDIDALTDFTYYDGNHDTGAVGASAQLYDRSSAVVSLVASAFVRSSPCV